jgi:hypothetical protein
VSVIPVVVKMVVKEGQRLVLPEEQVHKQRIWPHSHLDMAGESQTRRHLFVGVR